MKASPNDPAAVDGIAIGVVPKQQRGAEVRARLLSAAVDEIRKKGIEGARVENIVAEAGTSWGTFFRYFPRKEDVLLVEFAGLFRDHIRPAFDRALADRDLATEDVARNTFDELMEPRISPRFQAEMILETVQHPLRFAAIIGEGELPLVALITQLMVTGRQRNEVRTDVPAHICAMVLTAGVVFPVSRMLDAVAAGELSIEQLKEVADQAFEVSWSGLRPQ